MNGLVNEPPRTLNPSWLFISAPRMTPNVTESTATLGGSRGPIVLGTGKGRLTKVQASAVTNPAMINAAIPVFMERQT
jgi:hypothetical protein